MAEPKWTPGPWGIEQRAADERWIMAGDMLVAVAYLDDPEDQEGDANAYLIAAAPDLYEALESAVEKLREYADMDRWSQGEGGGCMSDPDEFIREAVEKGEAALRKARGETT